MPRKMPDDKLSALVNAWIAEARQFDRSDLADHREWAIRFYDGEVDFPAQPGRSQVVSHDVADVLEWVLPGLLRVFTSSDRVAVYEPRTPQDEAGARQATDAINYVFLTECDGYRVMKDSMHDGLLHGNGPVKVWWEGSPEYEVEVMRGLTEEEYAAVISQPDIEEVLEVTEYFVSPDGTPLEGDAKADMQADIGARNAAY